MNDTSCADLRAHVRSIITAAIPESGEYTNAELTDKILAQLQETEPDVLDAWVRCEVREFIAEALRAIQRGKRSIFRSRRRKFHDAMQAYDDGDVDAFDPWDQDFVVADGNIRKNVASMTGSDCSYVADDYARSANESKLEEAFWRAVARKCGKRQIADVMDRATFLEIRLSLAATK